MALEKCRRSGLNRPQMAFCQFGLRTARNQKFALARQRHGGQVIINRLEQIADRVTRAREVVAELTHSWDQRGIKHLVEPQPVDKSRVKCADERRVRRR